MSYTRTRLGGYLLNDDKFIEDLFVERKGKERKIKYLY
jgi:hypothetical protein